MLKWRCIVKSIVAACIILVLQGLSSFAQTNAAPAKSRPVPRIEGHGQNAAPKPKTPDAPAVPPQGALSHVPQHQLPPGTMARISREGLLTRRKSQQDYGAGLERIFRSDNEQMGETCIRDTVVTIFPPGR